MQIIFNNTVGLDEVNMLSSIIDIFPVFNDCKFILFQNIFYINKLQNKINVYKVFIMKKIVMHNLFTF